MNELKKFQRNVYKDNLHKWTPLWCNLFSDFVLQFLLHSLDLVKISCPLPNFSENSHFSNFPVFPDFSPVWNFPDFILTTLLCSLWCSDDVRISIVISRRHCSIFIFRRYSYLHCHIQIALFPFPNVIFRSHRCLALHARIELNH